MSVCEPIRDVEKLQKLAEFFLIRKQYRNHAMLVLGVSTALRIGDLLMLTWGHVCEEKSGEFRTHITITEKKTGKRNTIALNQKAIAALRLLIPYKRNVFIFANNRKEPAPISRTQAWRIIKNAVEATGLTSRHIAVHSLRKTFGYHAWVSGTSPVVLMDIYNHSSYEMTRRYLGVAQDDRDKVYLSLVLF